jgi:prevent-host-death family protein
MSILTLNDFKVRLSEWLARVAKGETVTITRYGKPWVEVRPTSMPQGLLIPKAKKSHRLKPLVKKSSRLNLSAYWTEDRGER